MYYLNDIADFGKERKQVSVKTYKRKGKVVKASKRNIWRNIALVGAGLGVVGLGVASLKGGKRGSNIKLGIGGTPKATNTVVKQDLQNLPIQKADLINEFNRATKHNSLLTKTFKDELDVVINSSRNKGKILGATLDTTKAEQLVDSINKKTKVTAFVNNIHKERKFINLPVNSKLNNKENLTKLAKEAAAKASDDVNKFNTYLDKYAEAETKSLGLNINSETIQRPQVMTSYYSTKVKDISKQIDNINKENNTEATSKINDLHNELLDIRLNIHKVKSKIGQAYIEGIKM